MGVFNPVFATYRLEHTATDRVARTLSAWSVDQHATDRGPDRALGPAGRAHQPAHGDRVAGVLLLATPLLLPRRAAARLSEPEPAPSRT